MILFYQLGQFPEKPRILPSWVAETEIQKILDIIYELLPFLNCCLFVTRRGTYIIIRQGQTLATLTLDNRLLLSAKWHRILKLHWSPKCWRWWGSALFRSLYDCFPFPGCPWTLSAVKFEHTVIALFLFNLKTFVDLKLRFLLISLPLFPWGSRAIPNDYQISSFSMGSWNNSYNGFIGEILNIIWFVYKKN